MKTSELTGAALDWAVAKCEGATDFWFDTVATHWVIKLDGKDRALRYGWAQSYLPSTDWAQGGPIIERFGVGVYQYRGAWAAHCPLPNGGLHACMENQPTPLIAAMRCYVASKLGDQVEIPEGLL